MKIWEGDYIQHEPVCFAVDGKGTLVGGKLLRGSGEILDVSSWDGTIHYRQGEDYCVTPEGLELLDGSRIPVLPRSVYCKPFTGQPETAWVRLPGGNEYMEVVSDVYRYQVLVSYRCMQDWQGFRPAPQVDRLPGTMERLKQGRGLNLVFYGDSITAGWEASGADEHAIDMVDLGAYHVRIQHPPYQPVWAELVTQSLREHFPDCPIRKVNRAAGGSTTLWGLENAATLVDPCLPDLVVLAFGMNSMNDPPQLYREQIAGILEEIRRTHPDCEFLLVSPMMPNQEIAGFQNHRLAEHQQQLEALCAENKGVALAPVHSVFREMEGLGKHYLELTGNCINHPNDFSIRVYAQCILAALGL